MTRLVVHTARISYGGPDRLDVTRRAVDQARKRGEPPPPGAAWAPSWGILEPVIEARRRTPELGPLGLAALEDAWSVYVEGYLEEQRLSYLPCHACLAGLLEYDAHTCPVNTAFYPPTACPTSLQGAWRHGIRSKRPAWENLLARERVVLVCYCLDAERCHRWLLRTRILPALGAVDGGELLQEAA